MIWQVLSECLGFAGGLMMVAPYFRSLASGFG